METHENEYFNLNVVAGTTCLKNVLTLSDQSELSAQEFHGICYFIQLRLH